MRNDRDFVQKRFCKVFRQDRSNKGIVKCEENDSFQKKFAKHFAAMCEAENPIVFPEEKITFTRTNKNITEAYTFKDIEKEYDINNKYYNVINNVCPDYKILLEKGLIGLKKEIDEQKKFSSLEEMDFLDSCEITIDAIRNLVKLY